MAPAIAYAAEPASTGTASRPVPMMPMLNSANAKSPAIGRSASAAWAEDSICVMPCAPSVAAVVSMMNMATRLEKPMPVTVSMLMRLQLVAGLFGGVLEWLRVGIGAQVFHFLRGLPEEQIRADGGAENRHHGGDVIRAPADRGQHCRAHNLQPRQLERERRDHIGNSASVSHLSTRT
jgi:hypothetical protein